MFRFVGTVAAICLLAGTATLFAQTTYNSSKSDILRNALAQAATRRAPDSRTTPIYAVSGLRLGARVQFDNSDYREYKCGPSDQFVGFTWCQKTRQERDRRVLSNVTYSILHSPGWHGCLRQSFSRADPVRSERRRSCGAPIFERFWEWSADKEASASTGHSGGDSCHLGQAHFGAA